MYHPIPRLHFNMAAERGDDPVDGDPSIASRGLNQVLDTRLLGRPSTLTGDEGEYNDWAFVMKSYLACIDGKFIECLNVIEGIKGDDGDTLRLSSYNDEHRRRAMTLHSENKALMKSSYK